MQSARPVSSGHAAAYFFLLFCISLGEEEKEEMIDVEFGNVPVVSTHHTESDNVTILQIAMFIELVPMINILFHF